MPESTPDPEYWNQRWLTGDTGWDMGRISPPLQHYFEQLPRKELSILIPGCGNSYEAAWLLENGFTRITLLDISPILTQRLREKLGATHPGSPAVNSNPTPPAANSTPHPDSAANLQILTGDFFNHQGQYDLIIEQTFFCSLEPAQRPAYVDKTHHLLRPGGRLAGLLFDRNFPAGPPFGGNKAEYQKLLEKKFTLKTLAPCYNSIKPRAGTELFFIAVRPD